MTGGSEEEDGGGRSRRGEKIEENKGRRGLGRRRRR